MIGQAFPEAALITDPIGWAFALWGGFLYWWAGAIYLVESSRLVRASRDTARSSSDSVER
jgi:cardiolipin synthase